MQIEGPCCEYRSRNFPAPSAMYALIQFWLIAAGLYATLAGGTPFDQPIRSLKASADALAASRTSNQFALPSALNDLSKLVNT